MQPKRRTLCLKRPKKLMQLRTWMDGPWTKNLTLTKTLKPRHVDSTHWRKNHQCGRFVDWNPLNWKKTPQPPNQTQKGAAVGIIKSYDDITPILVAIVAHKFFSAFALGISLVKSGVAQGRTVQLVISFSFSTPGGIVLGWLASHLLSGSLNSLTTEIVKGIAAGTFIYVAMTEILLEEFSHAPADHQHHQHHQHHHSPSSNLSIRSDTEDDKPPRRHDSSTERYNKFLFVLLGVVTMSIFSMYTSH